MRNEPNQIQSHYMYFVGQFRAVILLIHAIITRLLLKLWWLSLNRQNQRTRIASIFMLSHVKEITPIIIYSSNQGHYSINHKLVTDSLVAKSNRQNQRTRIAPMWFDYSNTLSG